MRLEPVFGAMIDGKYDWVPMESVQSLTLSEPEGLRDLAWALAEIVWTNDGKSVNFVPAQYLGITPESEPGYAIARKTGWIYQGGGFFYMQGSANVFIR